MLVIEQAKTRAGNHRAVPWICTHSLRGMWSIRCSKKGNRPQRFPTAQVRGVLDGD